MKVLCCGALSPVIMEGDLCQGQRLALSVLAEVMLCLKWTVRPYQDFLGGDQ